MRSHLSAHVARNASVRLPQGSFPPELSLEPVDVEQLYDAMRAAVAEGHVSSSVGALTLGSQADDAGSAGAGAWHAQAAAQLEELAPELYFAGLAGGGANRGPFFTRQQVGAAAGVGLEAASDGCVTCLCVLPTNRY